MLVGISARLRNVDNDDFHVKVYDNVLENVDNYKSLGVIVDKELKWHDQVNNVMRKVFGKLALLHRLKVYLDPSTLKHWFNRILIIVA